MGAGAVAAAADTTPGDCLPPSCLALPSFEAWKGASLEEGPGPRSLNLRGWRHPESQGRVEPSRALEGCVVPGRDASLVWREGSRGRMARQ